MVLKFFWDIKHSNTLVAYLSSGFSKHQNIHIIFCFGWNLSLSWCHVDAMMWLSGKSACIPNCTSEFYEVLSIILSMILSFKFFVYDFVFQVFCLWNFVYVNLVYKILVHKIFVYEIFVFKDFVYEAIDYEAIVYEAIVYETYVYEAYVYEFLSINFFFLWNVCL